MPGVAPVIHDPSVSVKQLVYQLSMFQQDQMNAKQDHQFSELVGL